MSGAYAGDDEATLITGLKETAVSSLTSSGSGAGLCTAAFISVHLMHDAGVWSAGV